MSFLHGFGLQVTLQNPRRKVSSFRGLDHYAIYQLSGWNCHADHRNTRCWVYAPSKTVAQNFRFLKTTVREVRILSDQDGVVTRSAEEITLTIPANQSYSQSIDLGATASFSDGKVETCNVALRSVDIMPDDNMEGVIGGVVKSAQAQSSVRHFVTPRKNEDLAQDYVEIKAGGITAGEFDQFYEWECSGGLQGVQGAESNKFKIKRDITGVADLKIKSKQGGGVVSRMKVWSVWSNSNPYFDTPIVKELPAKSSVEFGSHFDWIIDPKVIVTDSEIPDLKDKNKTPPPNPTKLHCAKGFPLVAGVGKKWDCSRQVKVKIINPNLIPRSELPKAHSLYDNQPVGSDVPENYPVGTVIEGNDDCDISDEKNDPYPPQAPHEIGSLKAVDRPTLPMLGSWGDEDDVLEERVHFREFVRLEIAQKWYRVSEIKLWKTHVKMQKQRVGVDLLWRKIEAVIEENNDGF